MTMDEGALQLASERLSEVAKEKETLLKYKRTLVEVGTEENSDEDPAEFLRDSIVDFNKGFKKAPETLKRRLLRETIQQLVLTAEGLAIWYYLADAKVPGNKLQLVKEIKQDPEGNETENLFLMPRASGDHSNLQVLRSVIGKNGEGCANLLEQAGAFSVSNRYAIKWAKDNLDLSELARLRWIEKWTVTRIANHLGWGRTAIVSKLGRMAKAPDSVVDGRVRSRIKSSRHRFIGTSKASSDPNFEGNLANHK